MMASQEDDAEQQRIEEHPVWTVYNELRTASLNVKYYSARLTSLNRRNFWLEFTLAATAPGSAIAGLFFWETEFGSFAWKLLGIITALLAVAKPFLKLTDRITKIEQTLTGYRGLNFDLSKIKTMIEQTKFYDNNLQDQFSIALERKKELLVNAPESYEIKDLKKKCQKEVLKEFPVESFFIPKEK